MWHNRIQPHRLRGSTTEICSGIEVVITALTRNQVYQQWYRGFESHPLRHVGAKSAPLRFKAAPFGAALKLRSAPLLLLSNSNPLRWASSWFLVRDDSLHLFLSTQNRSEISITAPFPPRGENCAMMGISSLSAEIRFAGFSAEKDGGRRRVRFAPRRDAFSVEFL